MEVAPEDMAQLGERIMVKRTLMVGDLSFSRAEVVGGCGEVESVRAEVEIFF